MFWKTAVCLIIKGMKNFYYLFILKTLGYVGLAKGASSVFSQVHTGYKVYEIEILYLYFSLTPNVYCYFCPNTHAYYLKQSYGKHHYILTPLLMFYK